MWFPSAAIKTQGQKLLAESIGRWCAPADGRNVIFCYHSIHPGAPFATPPDRFEQHLAYLRECCEVAPFGEIERPSGEVPPRPRVTVTFDDGYLDNYEIAAP
ncbi:MAG TPA: hypothetical protein VF767_06470, partial [Bryobacteraceae bacterium]